MTDTVIIEDDGEESGEVLAEAAVLSAAVAGHADAQAERAVEWTGEIADEVESVEALARSAAVEASSKPGAGEVEALVDAKVESAFDRLANMLAERMSAPTVQETAVVEAPKKDEAPASVKKQKKKRTFAERYMGIGEEDE